MYTARSPPIGLRWVAGSVDRARRYAAELVALASDVIFASGAAALGPLQQASRRSCLQPVFDPVGAAYAFLQYRRLPPQRSRQSNGSMQFAMLRDNTTVLPN